MAACKFLGFGYMFAGLEHTLILLVGRGSVVNAVFVLSSCATSVLLHAIAESNKSESEEDT